VAFGADANVRLCGNHMASGQPSGRMLVFIEYRVFILLATASS
jgi:hypothetical protein